MITEDSKLWIEKIEEAYLIFIYLLDLKNKHEGKQNESE